MLLEQCGHEALILLALSVILLSGFLLTRLTKRLGLPGVSAYILTGILIGPHLLNIIPADFADHTGFISDIALAFIAFGAGRFFKKESLRKTGASVVLITLFESLLAGALVMAAMLLIFHLDFSLALLLGAIATATAPASTLMTIKQYGACGEFVDALLQVVALDDVVCLLSFSAAAATVDAGAQGVFSAAKYLLPVLLNVAAPVAGGLLADPLARLLGPGRSRDNRLIIAIALLLGLSGVCAVLGVSPLLACMAFGAVYANKAQDEALFNQLDAFTPPVMLFFFVASGMNLNLRVLASFGAVGVVYFWVRILGKYIGARIGCYVVKAPRPTRTYLGVALVPQAGVAIGLAYLARRILPEDIGSLLMTIILASSVLYELIGPLCAKTALMRSGAIPEEARTL